MTRTFMASLLLAATALPTAVIAQTPDNIGIDRDDVPPAVWRTVRSVAPTAAFTEFGYEMEDGVKVFELGARDADGLHLELDVLPDGTLEEIEWETPLSQVQTPVLVEFRLSHPDATPQYVERSIRPNGHTVYEIEGRTADGELIDFEVMNNGRRLMVLNAVSAAG
ncbi:hypothetical protein [uncultured Algimonas sp.]|uniref:hypothetical protein n=1 Tax=uncultured Algimonas sp. TaxID=1547920 RepID=UPI0026241018|nr:hypothetical protein [uncultured Algimonas sp.]